MQNSMIDDLLTVIKNASDTVGRIWHGFTARVDAFVLRPYIIVIFFNVLMGFALAYLEGRGVETAFSQMADTLGLPAWFFLVVIGASIVFSALYPNSASVLILSITPFFLYSGGVLTDVFQAEIRERALLSFVTSIGFSALLLSYVRLFHEVRESKREIQNQITKNDSKIVEMLRTRKG